ncbi:MAG: hypothetical protein ACKVOK_14700, partial [Flavobacteriales bacterium]
MNKTLSIVLVFSLLSNGIISQVCTGDFYLEDQQMVDDFLVNNPTCTVIDGNVYIGVSGNLEEITNLGGLQNITEITGDLQIQANGPANMSLVGLGNLTIVGGLLQIGDNVYWDNPGYMPVLTGLENLVSVQFLDLTINGETELTPLFGISEISTMTFHGFDNAHHNMLNMFPNVQTLESFVFHSEGNTISLSGFDALIDVGEIIFYTSGSTNFLTFDAFHNLQTCDYLYTEFCYTNPGPLGFESLETAGNIYLDFAIEGPYFNFGSLQTADNLYIGLAYMDNITGFNSLTHVTQELTVEGWPTIISFPLLQEVGALEIWADDAGGFLLESIQFPELDSIIGDFRMREGYVTNLDFLENLEYIGGQVILNDNPLLSDCAIEVVCEKLSLTPEDFILEGNAAGCNSTDEIIAMCTTSYVTGSVFADLDCDGVFNNDDIYLPNSIIHDQNDLPVGSTYNGGNYLVGLPDNTTTTISTLTPVGFYPSSEFTFTTTTLDDIYSDVDFALCPDPAAHNFSVFHYSTSSPRPGFERNYYIRVENLGANIDDAEVIFDISGMPGASVVNSYGGVISGNTITWTISDLNIYQSTLLHVTLYIDPSIALGTIYQSTTTVNIVPGTITDIDLSDNVFSLTQTVIGSYDPNDKTVNIPALDIETLSSSDAVTLDYTIRFQNTGTAEAIFVRVEDIIEEDLDLTTFQMLNASHPFQLTFDEDRRVEWLFENIMLPDSATDEEGSHGYIHFRINTKNNLQLTDTISNNCAIYFDYNEPINTNTATTIFYECPEELAIITEGNYCEGESISVLATYGWEEYSWTVNDQPDGTGLGISIDNAAPGIYFITCEGTTAYCEGTTGYEFFVEETPDAVVITGDQDICEGENFELSASSGWDSYSWIQNGDVISNANILEIIAPANGVSTIELITSTANCESTSELSLYVGANPPVTIEFNLETQLIAGPTWYMYDWYINGLLIEGENLYTINPWLYGVDGFEAYAIVTGPNECTTTTNTVSYVGLVETTNGFVEVYPNPMTESTF